MITLRYICIISIFFFMNLILLILLIFSIFSSLSYFQISYELSTKNE